MVLLRFLFAISPRQLISAIAVGLAAGVASAGLIAVINAQLGSSASFGLNLPLAFVALGSLMLVSNAISRVLLARVSQHAAYEVRIRLSKLIMDAAYRRVEQMGAARLQAALTDDVVTITNAFMALPPLCVGVAILAACLVYLASLLPGAFLSLAVVIALGIAVYQFGSSRGLDWLRRAREKQNGLFEHLRALLHGNKELRLNRARRQAFFDSALGPAGREVRDDTVRGITWFAAAESWGQFLFFLSIGALLFVVPRLFAVPRPQLMAYALVLLYMMTPIQAILSLLPLFGRAEVAVRQIERLGLTLSNAAESKQLDSNPTLGSRCELRLEDVMLAYENETGDRPFVLGPVSARFRSGEIVFLTGGNGSGKTTFAKIITGLYTPDSGSIYLNGCEITPDLGDVYRQAFSAVFSDFFLFDGLLGFNHRGAEERIASYLDRFELSRKVRFENGKFSTLDLSQGHRKRLALLVSYLEDREFFVFDEWAADQDPEFKEIFYSELLSDLKSRNKAVIVISHDDRYFGYADRIIRLESGRVGQTERIASASAVSA